MQGLTLKEVTLTPVTIFTLFSLTKRHKEGRNIHGDEKDICLTKGYRKVVFDIVINTPKGKFLCAYFKINGKNVAAALDGTNPKTSIHLAHEILVHMDEKRTRLSAKGLG